MEFIGKCLLVYNHYKLTCANNLRTGHYIYIWHGPTCKELPAALLQLHRTDKPLEDVTRSGSVTDDKEDEKQKKEKKRNQCLPV